MTFRKRSAGLTGISVSIVLVASHVAASSSNSDESWGSSSPDAGSSGDWGDAPVIPPYYDKVRVAHASLAAAAWLIFFPLGAILIRVLETSRMVQIHYAVQMIGCYMFMAAAGMGIWMAKTVDVLNYYHPIIGMVLLGSLALQPLTELLNHFFYRRFPRIIVLAHVHIWFGRLLITLGIIQGGLGFAFSGSLPEAVPSPAPRIAYGIVAVIVWILYVSLAIVWPQVKHTFAWWRTKYAGGGGEPPRTSGRSFSERDV